MDHTICPGSKFMRQPKPEAFTCPNCNEDVEIWSDELSGRCSACGTMVMSDGTMSCLKWCAMGRDCVGDDVYDSFQERKAVTIKEQLLEMTGKEAADGEVNVNHIERALHYAELLARSEEAGTVLRTLYKDRSEEARKALLRMGFQISDIDMVCGIIISPEGGAGETTVNERVVYDAHRLARFEEMTAGGYSGDSKNDMGKLRQTLQTRTGTDIARHVHA